MRGRVNPVPAWWRSLFAGRTSTGLTDPTVDDVNRLRADYHRLGESDLKVASRSATSLAEVVAISAVVAARVLGQRMFYVQIRGALALANGRIVEMQTGEGETLAAGPGGVPVIRFF